MSGQTRTIQSLSLGHKHSHQAMFVQRARKMCGSWPTVTDMRLRKSM